MLSISVSKAQNLRIETISRSSLPMESIVNKRMTSLSQKDGLNIINLLYDVPKVFPVGKHASYFVEASKIYQSAYYTC